MTAIDPRFKSTIPVHAGVTEFTPASLDPLGRFNKDLPGLEAAAQDAADRHAELMRRRDAGEIVGTHAEDLLVAAAAEKIGTLAAIANRRNEAEELAKRIGPPPVFAIKVPTAVEREQINVRLVEMGLTTVSEEQVRCSLIETIYEIDWSMELQRADLDSDTHADDTANRLDAYWQKQAIQAQAFDAWRAQETERLLDRAAGAPPVAAEEMPVRLVSPREEARMQLLVDRLMEEPRMRRILAKRLDFSRRNAMIIVRINVRAVHGLGIDVSPDPMTNALIEESAAALREAFEKRYGRDLGTRAWLELVTYIDSLYGLEEFEQGNSDSPLAKPLDPTGSIAPSGDTSTNGGSSTGSDTGPVPDAGSVMITARLSDSISAAETPNTSNGPTGAA